MGVVYNGIIRFIKGFFYAGRGIILSLIEQRNLQVHLLATMIVVTAGLYFEIRVHEWLFVVVAIGLVWMAELMNTAIEYLTDLVTSENHPLARKAKDAAAGAVLVSALIAALIGSIVFVPYVCQ